MTRSPGRIATTAAMLVICGGAAVMAALLHGKAAVFPLIVAIPASLLCLAQLVIDLTRPAGQQEEGPIPAGRSRREAEMLGWLLAFLGALVGFGFLIGGTAIVFLYLVFGERATTAAICALSVALIVYLVFDRFLGLPLFEGLVMRAVF
jgi:hypothetical protein